MYMHGIVTNIFKYKQLKIISKWVAKLVGDGLLTWFGDGRLSWQLSGFESRHFSKLQKWATLATKWPTHSCPPKKYTKYPNFSFVFSSIILAYEKPSNIWVSSSEVCYYKISITLDGCFRKG